MDMAYLENLCWQKNCAMLKQEGASDIIKNNSLYCKGNLSTKNYAIRTPSFFHLVMKLRNRKTTHTCLLQLVFLVL